MKGKENPGLVAGTEGNAPYESEAKTTAVVARASSDKRPKRLPSLDKALRTHGNLLWAAPPRTISYARLHALRMQSAWRLTRSWLSTASSLEAALHDLPLVLPMLERKLRLPLPVLSPPFAFDELDAVQMVLDAARYESRFRR